MNPLDQIRVVLVEPMIGGNIGAVCRAINNNDHRFSPREPPSRYQLE